MPVITDWGTAIGGYTKQQEDTARRQTEQEEAERKRREDAKKEFETLRNNLQSQSPATIIRWSNKLAERAEAGDEKAAKQFLAVEDLVEPYKDLVKRAETGDETALKELATVPKAPSTLNAGQRLLTEANKAVVNTGKAFVEAPVELGKKARYALSSGEIPGLSGALSKLGAPGLKQLYDEGKITNETYGNLLNELGEEAGFGIQDTEADIARKTGVDVAQTLADIFTVGKAGGALKTAGKSKLAQTIGSLGVGQGAKLGGFYGGTEALQADDPTIGSVATGTGVGAAAGGTLAGLVGLLGRKLGGSKLAETTGRQVTRTPRGTAIVGKEGIEEVSEGSTKVVAQDVRFDTVPTSELPTSRAKHFGEAFQDTVKQIEDNPQFKEEFFSRGGRTVPVAESYTKAANAGLVPEEQFFKIKAGEPVSTVDAIRVRATAGTYIKEAFDDMKQSITTGKFDDNIQKKASDALAIENIVTGEPGRALNIQQYFNDDAFKLFNKYQELLAANGGRPPTGKQFAAWEANVQKSLEKAKQQAIKTKDPMWRQVISGIEEYATAAKVSSPITHIRNVAGNSLTFVQRSVEQPLGVGIRAARGQTGLGEAKFVFGTRAGWQTAAKKFWGIMSDAVALREGTEEFVEEGSSRLAREGFKEAIPGKLGRAIRIPFKFLEAADEFGKTILRDSSLHSQAYELAYQEGFRGNKLAGRIAELVEKPTKDLLEVAQKEALEYTFQSDLGKVGKWVQKGQNLPGGRIFIPFIKTPTNIAKFQAQRSILGLVSPRNIGAITKGTAREQANALARMSTGAALSFGSYQYVDGLYDEGKITGAVPDNPGERDLFYAQGKRPYSIKLGDKWYSYQNIQPVGMYLLQGVSLKEALNKNDEGGAIRIASSMAATAAKGLSELPFVKGMNDIVEAITDPERSGGRFIEQVATGFVPNILRDFTYWQDALIRAPENLQEQIKTMLPGKSQEVAPRLDILGRNVQRDENKLLRSFGRVGVTAREDDQLVNALVEIGEETGYYPGFPDKKIRGKELSADEYRQYQRVSGEIFRSELARALESSQFTEADPEQKKKDVEGMVERARDEAADQLFGEPEKKPRGKRRKY